MKEAWIVLGVIIWLAIGVFDAGKFNGMLRHDFAVLDYDPYHAREDCGAAIVLAGISGPAGVPAVAMYTGGYASDWTLSCAAVQYGATP